MRDYNGMFGGQSNRDDRIIQRALQDADANGDKILVADDREYDVNWRHEIPSGITIIAEGAIFNIKPQDGAGFSMTNKQDITWRGGCFRYKESVIRNWWTCFWPEDSTDITIEDVLFDIDVTNVVQLGISGYIDRRQSTIHTILAKNCQRLDIRRCRSIGGQFILGNTGHAKDIRVTDCQFENNHGYAISVAASNQGIHQRKISNVRIDGNRFFGSGGRGVIFVGTDGDNDELELCENVSIDHNTISGSWALPQSFAITFRFGKTGSGCFIDNNFIDPDPTAPPEYGILIKPSLTGNDFAGLRVSQNLIGHCSVAGARVVGGRIRNLRIANNHFEQNNGLQLVRGTVTDAIIESNHFDSRPNAAAIFLHAYPSGDGQAYTKVCVRENYVRNAKYATRYDVSSGATMDCSYPRNFADNCQDVLHVVGSPTFYDPALG